MIREVTNSKLFVDEISEVLGSKIYAQRAYFNELRDKVLGTHSTDLIGVSRHYLMLMPQVIVDFEPAPNSGTKFYVDEKRKFFMEKGIVYVPVFIGEILSKDQFFDRVKQERENLVRGYREALEDASLISAKEAADPIFSHPEVLAFIEKETLRRCKGKRLRGIAKLKHIPHVKEQIIKELRSLGKDGILGHVRSAYPSQISA